MHTVFLGVWKEEKLYHITFYKFYKKIYTLSFKQGEGIYEKILRENGSMDEMKERLIN